MEVSEVRRRLRAAIDKARHDAVGSRTRRDAATHAFEDFLSQRAVPMFHQFAAALVGEGHHFKVFTPAESVRLASEHSPEDFIELSLDGTTDPPEVIGRVNRGRGRRTISSERPLRERIAIEDLGEEDVLEFLLKEIEPFL
jgi:hypothetical protein